MCIFFLAIESFRTTEFMWNACFGVRPTDSAHRQKKIIAKTIIRICPFRQILSCSNLPTSSVELIWPITELYFRQILSTDFMNRFCQDVKTGPKSSEVSSCEQVQSNAPSSMVDATDKGSKTSEVDSCEHHQSNAPSTMVDDTDEGSKSSEVSSSEQG